MSSSTKQFEMVSGYYLEFGPKRFETASVIPFLILRPPNRQRSTQIIMKIIAINACKFKSKKNIWEPMTNSKWEAYNMDFRNEGNLHQQPGTFFPSNQISLKYLQNTRKKCEFKQKSWEPNEATQRNHRDIGKD